jgi:hypothetical protein
LKMRLKKRKEADQTTQAARKSAAMLLRVGLFLLSSRKKQRARAVTAHCYLVMSKAIIIRFTDEQAAKLAEHKKQTLVPTEAYVRRVVEAALDAEKSKNVV